MRTRVLFQTALVLLVFFVSAELCVRGRLLFQDVYIWDNDGLFRYKPFCQVGDSLALTTNNAGFFGDTLSEPKRENVFRVFILGDSTVANPEIPDAVKTQLQLDYPSRSFEVNSTGIPRYTSYHNLLLVKNYLDRWKPDCLVVYLGMNDNVYNTNPNISAEPPVGLWRWSDLTHVVVWDMLWYYGVHKRFMTTPEFDATPSVPRFEKHLREILEHAKQTETSVLLIQPATGFPTEDKLLAKAIQDAEKPMQHFWGKLPCALKGLEAHRQVLQRLATTYAIPLVDAQPVLPRSSEFFRDLCHFTSSGNRLFGRFIAQKLESEIEPLRAPTFDTTQ